MSITTEKELGEALKNRQDTLEIEGDLKTKVLRIKATGRVAWGLVFVLLAAAILIFLGTGGVALPASGVIGGGAVAVLGLPAAWSAVAIGVAAGGAYALNDLRAYSIVHQDDQRIILKRK